MDKKVAEYLQKQGVSQKAICLKLRDMIIKTFPEIQETVMSEGLWYEGKFYITAFKDHVNLGVGVKGLTDEELKHFEGKGESMRHLKFNSVSGIDENKLLELMQLVYRKTDCVCKINWKN